jgi:PD-(D/E)XK nuclease superfamily
VAGIGEDGRTYTSNSSLHMVSKCETLTWLTINGYTTSDEAAPLLAGSALHASMETYLRTGSKVEALETLDTHYFADWSRKHLPFFHRQRIESVHKTLARWYDEHPIPKLPYTVNPDFTEKHFSWPLDDDGEFVFMGYPDHVGRMRKDRLGIVIVDHKSTKNDNEYFRLKFEMDTQITSYWWMAEHTFDEPVVMFYINAIELKAVVNDNHKKCSKHGVPWSQCAVKHSNFNIISFVRNPHEIAEWHRGALKLARQMKEILERAPDISKLNRIRQDGMFREHCTWCHLRLFCKNGRPVNRIKEYLIETPPEANPDKRAA